MGTYDSGSVGLGGVYNQFLGFRGSFREVLVFVNLQLPGANRKLIGLIGAYSFLGINKKL